MTISNEKLFLPKRNFYRDDSNEGFIQKAITFSIGVHLIFFLIKFPNQLSKIPVKEKLASIKMNFITPPESYRLNSKEKIQKVIADTNHIETQAGSNLSTSQKSISGDPKQTKLQKQHLSKSGSPKKGPLSSPGGGTQLGDSSNKGFQLRGKGLNALTGNSQSMSLLAGSGGEGSRSLTGGAGLANKGNNLSGDYRAPSGLGDGSGHLLGKDTAGNYDRSTSTKGLAGKKGIDTAFVQTNTVVLGSIDPDVLRKILGEYLSQFKFCYQQELQENSEKIRGIVDLNFRIDGEGHVSRVDIKSAQTKFSDRGIGCMSGILRTIEFPRPKGGGLVDVRQPLNFFSENTKI